MRDLFLLTLLVMALTTSSQSMSQPVDASLEAIAEAVERRQLDSPLFNQALNIDDPALMQQTLLGLGRIGGKEASVLLTSYLAHSNPALRKTAALALGISGVQASSQPLWAQLKQEKDAEVRAELYLALGNLGENGLISRMLAQAKSEDSAEAKAALFQALTIALVFHPQLKDDFAAINYSQLLNEFAAGNDLSAPVGYFLSRLPQIENHLSAKDLVKLTQAKLSTQSKVYLARLIEKVSQKPADENRALLAWLVEQSEHPGLEPINLNLQIAATNAMKYLLDMPQAQMQIGKLTVSNHPVIAQTALKVLVDSTLNTSESVKLLQAQLTHANPAMLVDAISGLVRRQSMDEMSWVVKLFAHNSAYVKINLLKMLHEKSANDFTNLIKHFSQDPNPAVSRYASNLLNPKAETIEQPAPSPSYAEAQKAARQRVKLVTPQGEIVIQLLSDAPYTAWHFVQTIESGFYNGSYFNRVIGNFVAQGGDPVGDGSGSNGQTIREEINFLAHEPMTVAMATAGKDTGSSQFFINTARNLHLDRNYTIFGRVIAGEALVYQMTHGTPIIRAEVVVG